MSSPPRVHRIGPVEVVECGRRDASVCVLMLHGYGADAFDLMPISQQLPSASRARWVFPQGVLEVPLGFQFVGRAWFPIDMAALQNAMEDGGYRDFSQGRPAGLDRASAAITELIAGLDVPLSRLIIGGFSQGAMVAIDTCLAFDGDAAGLVAFSGALVDREGWRANISRHSQLRYVQSHGQQDPILAFDSALQLNQMFRTAGLDGVWVPFPGGHEIPAQALHGLDEMIRSVDRQPR